MTKFPLTKTFIYSIYTNSELQFLHQKSYKYLTFDFGCAIIVTVRENKGSKAETHEAACAGGSILTGQSTGNRVTQSYRALTGSQLQNKGTVLGVPLYVFAFWIRPYTFAYAGGSCFSPFALNGLRTAGRLP